MKHLLLPLLLLAACADRPGGSGEHASTPPSPIEAIILAQDQRDTPRLLAFLADTSATVRARAALALASAGNDLAVGPLLNALSDSDPTVRCNAAFAFGFCGDSLNVHQLMERFSPEDDPAVRGRIAEAAGRCGRRNGADLLLRRSLSSRQDTLGVLRGLFFATTTNSTDTAHVRYALSLVAGNDMEVDEAALQVCARSRAALVEPVARELLNIAMMMPDSGGVELRLPLINALGKTGHPDAFIRLQESLVNDPDPRMRVMALRGIGRFEEPKKNEFIWAALKDSSAMVRDVAVEQLLTLTELPDGHDLWMMAQEHNDYAVKIPLYGLVMKLGDEDTRTMCRMLLKSMSTQDPDPYLSAELLKARASTMEAVEIMGILRDDPRATMKQAAFSAAVARIRENMARSRFADRSAQYAELSAFLRDAMATGDAGIISAAAELMSEEEPEVLSVLLTDSVATKAKQSLLPIRDLESIQLLDASLAKRDGRSTPKHAAPPFNHAIDKSRLATIKHGQQYRIRTNKGDIVLVLEPNAAPGSCTAFDSLVTAGYYNGKYFHRVVPDFVAQGGCPRGDGYGGMPWTLRTEIGLDGFTTGAVGLASAGKDTESCQFFIMLADAPHLDGRYTRFAHLESGLEVALRLRVGDVMNVVERMP